MARTKTRGVGGELTEPEFHVLLALTGGEGYGYEIMGEITRRTGGEVSFEAGTLYGVLKRLLREGLIEERPDEERGSVAGRADRQAGRRRYYRLTARGRRRLSEEAGRLERKLSMVRDHGVRPSEAPDDASPGEDRDPVLRWDEEPVLDERLPPDASVSLDDHLYG